MILEAFALLLVHHLPVEGKGFCSSLSQTCDSLSAFLISLGVSLCSSLHFYILKASQAAVSVIDLNLVSVTSLWPLSERKLRKIGRTGQFTASR